MISVKTVNNIADAFPIGILAQKNVLTPEENDLLIAKVYKLRNIFGAGNTRDWLSGKSSPDNCYRQSNIAEYLEFRPLVERVAQCVRELARSYGSDDDYYCTEGWYNIYSSNRYQEYHVHPNAIFSAEERTVIIFRSYLEHCVPPSNLKTDRVTVALNFA